ncbi:MAG: N-acetyltransferase [Geobacteraceae bacterium]|jgi:acyl-[acyl carrier protein]--UDP-N-acetylglucosamine O-acyltransferase|nr:MAG: N-acetyltransferase [Geobacteraceae bacterium]
MIHPTAIVSDKAKIGKHVSIGAFTTIYENVIIGDETTIESYCEIGHPSPLDDQQHLVIGNNSFIRSYSLFYRGSVFGDRLVTGHRVTVREKVIAGVNLQIGTLSDIQGDCIIGDYVRTHSNVHISKHSTLGNFVWIYPYVVLTNDPHPPSTCTAGVIVEDYAVVATMSVVLPGVRIGTHSLVAAHSLVNRDVPPYFFVGGSPAKELGKTTKIKLRDESGQSAYPWPRHFHRGYPDVVVKEWLEKFK